MRTKRVTIEKGWYFSCGKGRWDSSHSMEGVGLNRELFQDSDRIIVTIKGSKDFSVDYELNTEEGRDFIRQHRSEGYIGGNRIGYVPRSLMKKVNENN